MKQSKDDKKRCEAKNQKGKLCGNLAKKDGVCRVHEISLDLQSKRINDTKSEENDSSKQPLNSLTNELRAKIEDLRDKVYFLRGAISVVTVVFSTISLILVFLSYIGFTNLIKYQKFENTREGINDLLTRQFLDQTTDIINQFTLTNSLASQRDKLNEISIQAEKLKGIDNDRLDKIKLLVDGLNKLEKHEIDRAMKLALEVADWDSNQETETDRIMKSYALTLYSLIAISKNRNKPELKLKDKLEKAKELDNTNPGAFNGLAIMIATQELLPKVMEVHTKREINENKYEEIMRIRKKAEVYFELTSTGDSSLLGSFRKTNNTIWINLITVKALLNIKDNREKYIDKFLSQLNYKSIESFFQHRKTLETYSKMKGIPPVALETSAQSRFLEAEYLRTKQDKKEDDLINAGKLEEEGTKNFKDAIDNKLYERVKDKKEKVKQFNEDFLHFYFVNQNPDLAQKITEQIK